MSGVVHLPDTWEGEQRGTACGLLFGMPGWLARHETVLTDPEEASDATCTTCRRGPVRQAIAALGVITNTPEIRRWLTDNDPQALRQAERAFDALRADNPGS